jgi:hypothetical protein
MFVLPAKGERVGVFVSGGWDSAVLWYIIKGHCIKNKIQCTPFTVPKLDGAVNFANKVLEWSCGEFGIPKIYTNPVGSIESENTSEYVGSGVREALSMPNIDVVYTAVNKYPSWMTPPADRIFTKDTEFENVVRQPFADLYKTDIVNMAFELGIGNKIMYITHSCTEREIGRCHDCWWCKEREWAFTETNHKDYGEE